MRYLLRSTVAAVIFGLALFAGPAPVTHGATINVTTLTDELVTNGNCSLREAIWTANIDAAVDACTAGSGTDTITFTGLAGTIAVSAALGQLPTIAAPVVIDGTTGTGYLGAPVIVLDGIGLSSGEDGLYVTAGNSFLWALAIVNFPDDGIELDTLGGNTVLTSYIGVDPDGFTDRGNGDDGIYIVDSEDNLIADSLISGNTDWGVQIDGSTATLNRVLDNYIGTNAAGDTAIPNDVGLFIDGAPDNAIGPGNVISGNSSVGVVILGSGATGNVVRENHIGTNAAGLAAIPNTWGLQIGSAPSNTIGPGNVISGNLSYGVEIDGSGATLNTVSDNKIGTNAAGLAAIPNGLGVSLFASAPFNTIGPGNVISGNTSGGVTMTQGSTDNTVRNNFIGLNAAGDAAIANGGKGFWTDSPSNTVGPGNVISGNTGDGVWITGSFATGNTVSDNYIGLNAAGDTAIPNLGDGVHIDGAPSNTVGPGNVISGNGDGVEINGSGATWNTVTGNFIGLNAAGDAHIPNGWGVYISDAPSNTIGPGNVIEGNTSTGVDISYTGATGNTVSDNFILLNDWGVVIVGAPDNDIGPGNVITLNAKDGVAISGGSSTGNTVTDNSIYANGFDGIVLAGGANGGIAAPTVTAVGSASGSSSDCASCTIEVFSDADDEGETHQGTATTAGGSCPCAWSFPGVVTGPNITATVTDSSGNTSEFSAPFVVPDTDGDGQIDTVDACPATFTPWETPLGDDDCDGDVTGVVLVSGELFFGTDPADGCSDTPDMYDERGSAFAEPEPAWPPDINDDQVSDFGDILAFAPHFGKTWPDPAYSARFDFYIDETMTVDFGDILSEYPAVFNKDCTDYLAP